MHFSAVALLTVFVTFAAAGASPINHIYPRGAQAPGMPFRPITGDHRDEIMLANILFLIDVNEPAMTDPQGNVVDYDAAHVDTTYQPVGAAAQP